MALDQYALVTLDEAKGFVKVPLSETGDDSLLENFINECTHLIESYCNRKFKEREFTDQVTGSGTKDLIPRQFPVISITELYDDTSRAFATPIDSANYMIAKNEKGEGYAVERFDAYFARGQRNVKLVYQAGYASIPYDIQLACKVCVAYYYFKQQQEDWTTATKSKGDEDITLIQGIPESATTVLDKYVRMEILGEDEPVRNY